MELLPLQQRELATKLLSEDDSAGPPVAFRAKGLSPWLRDRMMLRAFPLLEGPDKARAAL